MKKLPVVPVALSFLVFCSIGMTSRAPAQTSATAPPAHPVLVIQSTPGVVVVYVDDGLVGLTSSEGYLKISTLKPGKHTLRARHGGYQDWQEQFSLIAGKSLTKTITLIEQVTAPTQPPTPQPPAQSAPAAQTQQSGPTLAETVNWIGQQVNGSRISVTERSISDPVWFRMEFSHSDFQARNDGCFLQWTMNVGVIYSNGPPEQHHYTESVGLKFLSPSAYVQEWREKNANEVASGDYPYYDVKVRLTGGVESTFDEGGLSFADQDIANRVATAFNHAIELCGGKKEPF